MGLDGGDNQMNTLGFKMVTALYKQQIMSKEWQKLLRPEAVNEKVMGENVIT